MSVRELLGHCNNRHNPGDHLLLCDVESGEYLEVL